MNVLMINGSPHQDGNTFLALSEMASTLNENDIKTEIVHLGSATVQGCIACYKCVELGHCIFGDPLYTEIRRQLKRADGVVIGSPVYFAAPNGSLCALLDRIFYSCQSLLQYKPAASVVICRRGGASAALDRLNKYFTISNMPVVSSQYWNMVYGLMPGEATHDAEGMQTMRTLGKNMAWLLKNLKKNPAAPIPEAETVQVTNFIR